MITHHHFIFIYTTPCNIIKQYVNLINLSYLAKLTLVKSQFD